MLDIVKGDAIRSVAGYYVERNHLVRCRFDELEKEFAEELPHVLNAAVVASGTDDVNDGRWRLDQFTEHCVGKVVTTVKELLETFGDPSFVSSTAK